MTARRRLPSMAQSGAAGSNGRLPLAGGAKPTAGEYTVGYGRPPVASRFAPGKSGNPNGRPKKRQDVATILERTLDMRVKVTDGGKRHTISMREAIIRGLVNDAARRDPPALRLLFALLTRHPADPDVSADESGLSPDDEAIVAGFLARRSLRSTPAALKSPEAGHQASRRNRRRVAAPQQKVKT